MISVPDDPTAERVAQRLLTLSPAQIVTARRFASDRPKHFSAGDLIFDVGQPDVPAWFILEGTLETTRRDGPGHEAATTTHYARQFVGEINQLSGALALAAGYAGSDGFMTVSFDAAHLRALLVGSADVGEIVMRGFILRRVALIALPGSGCCWSAIREARRCVASSSFSLAAAIRCRCSTRLRTTKAARSSSGSACLRTSCR